MELHQALKHIIRSEGQGIVTDLRLINILNDLNAYQEIQGSKYILRAIIDDGFASRFYQIGSLNNQANDLIHRFITTTGFNEENVLKIFQSLAFGLGWISQMPLTPAPVPSPTPTPTSQQKPASTQPSSVASTLMLTSSKIVRKSQDFRVDYCERAADYLDSITEVRNIHNLEIKVFAKLEIYDNPTSNIVWSVEVNGNIPMKKGDIITQPFEIVLYNHSGRILTTQGVYTYNPVNGYGVLTTEPVREDFFKCVGNIGKIVVYPKK